jgi:hypothetical protein
MSAASSIRPVRQHARGLLLLALVAFWLAQALAVAHASRHVGGDAPGLPGDHAQLCTDCASMLPLLSVADGVGTAFVFAPPVRQALLPVVEIRAVTAPVHRAFRSRAPPY